MTVKPSFRGCDTTVRSYPPLASIPTRSTPLSRSHDANPRRQPTVPGRVVIDLKPRNLAGQRHVKRALAGIDPSCSDVMLHHLPRPLLAMRTLSSVNHTGPMKSRSRSCSGTALAAMERTIRRPAARPGWPSGPGRSSRNRRNLHCLANTRSAHLARLEGSVQRLTSSQDEVKTLISNETSCRGAPLGASRSSVPSGEIGPRRPSRSRR